MALKGPPWGHVPLNEGLPVPPPPSASVPQGFIEISHLLTPLSCSLCPLLPGHWVQEGEATEVLVTSSQVPRRTAGTWEKPPAEKHIPTKTLRASQLPVALCPSPKFQASLQPETQLQTASMPACNQDFKFNNVTGSLNFLLLGGCVSSHNKVPQPGGSSNRDGSPQPGGQKAETRVWAGSVPCGGSVGECGPGLSPSFWWL